VSEQPVHPDQPKPLPQAVVAAVDAIIAAMGFGAADRLEIIDTIRVCDGQDVKLPHVSLYSPKARSGRKNYRATYTVPGFKTHTERLGRSYRLARKRAERISEVLQQVKARMMKPEEAHRILYVDNTPIERHLSAFESSLKSKGSVPRYVKTTVTRLGRCVELGRFDRLGDIKGDKLPGLIDALQAYVDPETKRKLSGSTINDYLATLRQFTKWATPTLLPVDPLVNSGGVKTGEKRDRRDVLVEELAEIIDAARRSTARYTLAGPDRAMLYLTAYGTGLRANELRSLQVSWLKLDETHPHIAIPKESQKKTAATKAVKQPLPTWLAIELKLWLGGRTTGKVFPAMPRDVAPLFDRDRHDARTAWIAAGATDEERAERSKSDFLARQTSDGVMVFHSHRHAFATGVLANMDLKSAQMLTRHATAAMLTDKYAHSRINVAAEGVERAIRDPRKKAAAGGAIIRSASG
jgi:integrase